MRFPTPKNIGAQYCSNVCLNVCIWTSLQGLRQLTVFPPCPCNLSVSASPLCLTMIKLSQSLLHHLQIAANLFLLYLHHHGFWVNILPNFSYFLTSSKKNMHRLSCAVWSKCIRCWSWWRTRIFHYRNQRGLRFLTSHGKRSCHRWLTSRSWIASRVVVVHENQEFQLLEAVSLLVVTRSSKNFWIFTRTACHSSQDHRRDLGKTNRTLRLWTHLSSK